MKKLLTTVFASFFAFTMNNAIADVSGFAVGVSVASNDLDTLVTDDIDNNGTVTTTKQLTDSVTGGSIFAETTLVGGNSVGITFGLEYIPIEADLDKRSATQASLKSAADGASTSGTNSGSATIEDHLTFYIQPGFVMGNTMIYGTLGYSRADIEATWESVSSTNSTKVQHMTGTKIGAGVKHVFDGGIFIKLDYSETDYDAVSYVTSNNTKVTGDIDNEVGALSMGYQF